MQYNMYVNKHFQPSGNSLYLPTSDSLCSIVSIVGQMPGTRRYFKICKSVLPSCATLNLLCHSLRVQSIQHQLAQLDSESWSGRAEADRDRDFMQLLREKEALLQEIILVSKQQHPPETLLQLEEERSRLEEEVQRAHSSQSQGANQRWEWGLSMFSNLAFGHWASRMAFLLVPTGFYCHYYHAWDSKHFSCYNINLTLKSGVTLQISFIIEMHSHNTQSNSDLVSEMASYKALSFITVGLSCCYCTVKSELMYKTVKTIKMLSLIQSYLPFIVLAIELWALRINKSFMKKFAC